MKDGYADMIVGSRMRLLELYHSEVHLARKENSKAVGLFGRGMIAGLKLALLHLRWLHREIRKKEEQGYRLVWLTPDEQDALDIFNP